MAVSGWMINLSGEAIPVYSVGNGGPSTTQIGTITPNECFIDGTYSTNPWEGDGIPVFFLNQGHEITFGLLANNKKNLVDFTDYASNGTSWVKVTTLERKVVYDTVTYINKNNTIEETSLPAASRVWLDPNGTAGQQKRTSISVTHIQRGANGNKEAFNGFVDLTYGNRWVNVGSILLRKV